MKNSVTFAPTNIHKGGLICPIFGGIFYALPSHSDTASLPCPSLMAGHTLVVLVNGSVAPFFYLATSTNNSSEMTNTEKNRLNGETMPSSNRPAHDTGDNSTYYFDDAHPVRTTMIDGQPWFAGIDVCRVLGIVDHKQAVATLDDDERGGVYCTTPGPVARQRLICVSESGLYALIFKSRKPEAKRFRKWVTSEVLPAIRKNGEYRMRTAEERRVAVKVARSTRVKELEEELDYVKGRYDYLSRAYVSLSERHSALKSAKPAPAPTPAPTPAPVPASAFAPEPPFAALFELADEIDALLNKFEVEKNAKNRAYDFIFSQGHLPAFTEFTHRHTEPAGELAVRTVMAQINM